MPSTEARVPELLRFGTGHVVLDPVTGAPTQFLDALAPVRRFLLEQAAAPWHSVEHQWVRAPGDGQGSGPLARAVRTAGGG
ncbi:hypothetical protein GCM10010415_75010 [Streptomyces atrovirens]